MLASEVVAAVAAYLEDQQGRLEGRQGIHSSKDQEHLEESPVDTNPGEGSPYRRIGQGQEGQEEPEDLEDLDGPSPEEDMVGTCQDSESQERLGALEGHGDWAHLVPADEPELVWR